MAKRVCLGLNTNACPFSVRQFSLFLLLPPAACHFTQKSLFDSDLSPLPCFCFFLHIWSLGLEKEKEKEENYSARSFEGSQTE